MKLSTLGYENQMFFELCLKLNLFQRSQWHNNQFIRGSYSYQTVESKKSGLGPTDLARPEGIQNRLLFAGEATSDRHFSTVHGAIESGWREADRIVTSLTEL